MNLNYGLFLWIDKLLYIPEIASSVRAENLQALFPGEHWRDLFAMLVKFRNLIGPRLNPMATKNFVKVSSLTIYCYAWKLVKRTKRSRWCVLKQETQGKNIDIFKNASEKNNSETRKRKWKQGDSEGSECYIRCKLNLPFVKVDVDEILLVGKVVVVTVVLWLGGLGRCASWQIPRQQSRENTQNS